jgi:uncharacterized protein (TIGR03435 family)
VVFCRAALIVIFAISFAQAQPGGDSSSFEVVSIKPPALPNGGPFYIGIRGGPGTSDPGRMTFSHVTLARLVTQAFGIYAFQLSCPDWLNTEQFDIIAKVPVGATKGQVPMMLQNLLADRFRLKVHRETRVMPILELTVAKGGPKLKAPTQVLAQDDGVTGEPSVDKFGFPVIPPGKTNMLVMDGRARWQAPNAEMKQLTQMLAGELGKPVTDSTGLNGRYDFSLYWMSGEMDPPELAPTADTDAPAAAAGTPGGVLGPTIFGALKDQLGLRLDAKKGPANILVVDSASRPTEN